MTFNYKVIWITVNGIYDMKFRTYPEAKDFAKKVKDLKASGVKVKSLA